MKGYYTDGVYKGYLPSKGRYQEFESDMEYMNYFKEYEEQKGIRW